MLLDDSILLPYPSMFFSLPFFLYAKSYPQATMVLARKNYHFKNRGPQKISGYGPGH